MLAADRASEATAAKMLDKLETSILRKVDEKLDVRFAALEQGLETRLEARLLARLDERDAGRSAAPGAWLACFDHVSKCQRLWQRQILQVQG